MGTPNECSSHMALVALEHYRVLFVVPQGAWVSGGVVGPECSSPSSVVKRTPLLSVAEVADVDRTFLAALGPLAVVGRVVGDALGGK